MDNIAVPAQDAFSLSKGAVFHDQYEVVRRIDSGAMGTVYEVLDRRTKRRRALKVMLARFVDNPEVTERFRREATVTADVVSEHVVETFDAGVDKSTGLPFLVMELLRGEDLGKVVARGPMPAADVVMLLIQASSAIDRMHAAGVVHRDLKPENLYITRRDDGAPRLKVLDFGIAKVMEKAATSATSTRNMGTPVYMSPEQVMGSGNVGPPVDLYAVGHLAFTMLTGQPYWLEDALAFETVYPLLLRIMTGATEAASVRALRNKQVRLPEGFDAWFAKATAHAPEERFRSATASILALATALDVPRPMLASWPLDQALGLAPATVPPRAEGEAATDPGDPAPHSESGAPVIPLVPRRAGGGWREVPETAAAREVPAPVRALDAPPGGAVDAPGSLAAEAAPGSLAAEAAPGSLAAEAAPGTPSPHAGDVVSASRTPSPHASDVVAARKDEAVRTLSPVSTLPDSKAVVSPEEPKPTHKRRLVAFGAAFFLAGVIGAVLLARGLRRPPVVDGPASALVAATSGPAPSSAAPSTAAPSTAAPNVTASVTGEAAPATVPALTAPAPTEDPAPPASALPSATARPVAPHPSTRRPPGSPSSKPSSRPPRPYGDPSRDL